MFFDGWDSVWRVVGVAAIIYVSIVALLRIFGEQALAKMSAYDLVVTVALGSFLAGIPLGSGVTVVDGLAAVGTYLVLQQILRWTIKRSRRAEKAVRDTPHVVVWDGVLLEDRLLKLNILKDEVRSAVRRAGKSSFSEVLAVILENDGEWSVVQYGDAVDLSTLEGLEVPWKVAPGTRQHPTHQENVSSPAGVL